MNHKAALFILILSLLASCAPSPERIQQAVAETQAAWTAVPTQTAYPTYTAPPTVFVTKLVIVTATSTRTPAFTPTITRTPRPTLDPLKQNKGNGFYLIGVDIAAGVWRSTGSGSSCYWAVTARNGDIIDNHFGQAGGTAYLPASGFQVQFEDCGAWEYLSPP